MGLLRRTKPDDARAVVRKIAPRLVDYGRFEHPARQERMDGHEALTAVIDPAAAALRRHGTEFVRELAAVVRPLGGWSCYGAHRLVEGITSPQNRDPRYLALLDDAIRFLRSEGLALSPYEIDRWSETRRSENP